MSTRIEQPHGHAKSGEGIPSGPSASRSLPCRIWHPLSQCTDERTIELTVMRSQLRKQEELQLG
jgi:hypothetical protein